MVRAAEPDSSSLRIALTIFAVLLIAALATAFVAPSFVDWNQRRPAIEAALSRAVGDEVKIAGAISVRLLPSPEIDLGKVSLWQRGATSPVFEAESLHAEIALSSLSGGPLRVIQAVLAKPIFRVTRGVDGGLLPPALDRRPKIRAASLDRLLVRDGQLDFADADGAPVQSWSGIEFDGSAGAVAGPFRGAGHLTAMATRFNFRFATGAVQRDALHVKATVEPVGWRLSSEFEGEVSAKPAPAGAPSAFHPTFAGAAVVLGSVAPLADAPPAPWRFAGKLSADEAGARTDGGDLELGNETRALKATGDVIAEFGAAGSMRASLSAKQLDLDAYLRQPDQAMAPPSRAYAFLKSAFDSGGALRLVDWPWKVELSTPLAILGSDSLTDVAISASGAPGGAPMVEAELGVPGQSKLTARGVIDAGPDASFKGQMSFQSSEPAKFADWLVAGDAEWQSRLGDLRQALPAGEIAASGRVELTPKGLSAQNLVIKARQSALTGTASFAAAADGARARVVADLTSDALEIEVLPNLTDVRQAWSGADLSLAIAAKSLSVPQLGEGQAKMGALNLKLSKIGETTTIRQFEVKDLGGAALAMTGAMDEKGAAFAGSLDAQRLDGLASALRQVLPGPLSELVAARAGELSPAKLTWSATALTTRGGAGLAPSSIDVAGNAGQTALAVKLNRTQDAAGAMSLALTLDAPDGGRLLRQLGFAAYQPNLRRASLFATARGVWPQTLDAEIKATLGEAELSWRGKVNGAEEIAGDARFFGAASLKTRDVGALAALAGLPKSPPGAALAADISGDVVMRERTLSLPQLRGTIAESKVSGNLAFRLSGADAVNPDVAAAQAIVGEAVGDSAAAVSGALAFDRLGPNLLAPFALGWPRAGSSSELWARAKFGEAWLEMPTIDISLRANALEAFDGLEAREASAHVRSQRGQISVEGLAFKATGGNVAGRATLRRAGADASLQGELALDGVKISSPLSGGRLSGSIRFEGAGESPRELAASMVGAGSAKFEDISVARLDAGALGRVVDAMQAGDALIDQTRVAYALDKELDKRPLAPPALQATATLGGGMLRLNPAEWTDGRLTARLAGDLDVFTLAPTLRASFADAKTLKFWSGAKPSIDVALKVANGKILREVEATSLAAGLATQSLARQSEAIAALDSDIRERAAFNRRLKAGRLMALWARELEARNAEQARLRAAEALATKPADDQQKALGADAPPTAAENASPSPPPKPSPPPAPKARPSLPSPPPDPTLGGPY